MSYSLEYAGMKIVFGGDTIPNKWFVEYAKDADLVIHEAFSLKDSIANHGSILSCLDLARQADIGHMAQVHLNREVRR
ncbi:MAG: hypothetical protein L3J38_05880, partial [Thiomicrorhabdus sp.]|nr:hypothetical protein [Thiomicrorhabdus sp.]